MNVFVTGGTGFVGAHLVKVLQARGDRVTCLVRRPELAERLGWTGVRLVRGDLDDLAALREGGAGADIVYHLAGQIVARAPSEFMATNRDGTANVLAAAQEQGARRFVLVSSLAANRSTKAGPPPRSPSTAVPSSRPKRWSEPYPCRGPSFARRWCTANGTVLRSRSSGSSSAGWH